MINLDILCKKFAAISPLQLKLYPEAENDRLLDICCFYTKKIKIAEGQAGHVITDEFLFCGKIVQRETRTVLLIGPATEYALTTDAKKRITTELGLRGKQATALYGKLEAIPIMQLTVFIQQLSFLNYIINEDETVLSNYSEEMISISARQAPVHFYSENHNTEEFEAHMLNCIEHGKLEVLSALLEAAAINQYTTGIISSDTLRSQKNILVTSTVLACRAAVRGGLNYDLALSISDKYLQQIEGVYTFDDFYHLWKQMLLDYTTRTANLRLHADASELVRSAARIISGQMYQKISVEQLAQDLNVSRSYLSHQFKRETGWSLTDFIAQQKIDEAVRLMQTTNMTLAEIAYQLAFSSQSYFHATFKKITGVNPGKYSRRLRVSDTD